MKSVFYINNSDIFLLKPNHEQTTVSNLKVKFSEMSLLEIVEKKRWHVHGDKPASM